MQRSAVYVRGEARLVLTAEQLSYFRAETTYYLVGGVYYNPLLLGCFLIGGNGLVTQSVHCLNLNFEIKKNNVYLSRDLAAPPV